MFISSFKRKTVRYLLISTELQDMVNNRWHVCLKLKKEETFLNTTVLPYLAFDLIVRL